QTTERRHLGGLTALSALVLVAVVALVTWLHFTGSRVADVPEPEHALAVVVGHSLDLDDGIDGASAWERRLYQMLLGSRADDLAAEADAELGPGWFRDRLVARLTRSEVPNPRAGVLLGRLRVLTAAEVAILAAALVMLASWARRRRERGRWGAATLPPPWRGRA